MDRIYFVDNPWPKGHRIVNFKWSAHFKYAEEEELNGVAGLYFDLHLETADYDEEDLEDDEEDGEDGEAVDDWHAKIVWNNFHSCTLSSEEWDFKGFRVGSDEVPFDLDLLNGKRFAIDFLSEDEQKNLDLDLTAFDVYLLGHDASAFHNIKLTRLEGQTYQIEWKGQLALAYIGDYEFKYDFHTLISSTSFSGINIPNEITDHEADVLLKRFVSNPVLFELQHDNGDRRFVLK
ncbi:hypothetical protein COI41_11650 [Bacillus toyonensis]|uniref:hypothetical protein n=1 Tax=Bacillus toyonensis TaxID=155322 RepID=UPI000BF10340|nr:hypothetical protein [Bacillus toyonensis]PEO67010.1 hypothetical protein CN567_06795 [Bacillus toyonensis]PFX78306.1 hypothetical protein COL37_24625 [Bacillus toyonensis]PFX82296.1 hypothetical protein COL38_10100 [Bacillus toyonensis]PGB06153.1 hypothetical protein COL98_27010 [Bacillus toyonensis]PHF55265.1 hypothetical protein COI41_11650 [Bacillus toyonensis]